MLVDAKYDEGGEQSLFTMLSVTMTPAVVGGAQGHGLASLELDVHLPPLGRLEPFGG